MTSIFSFLLVVVLNVIPADVTTFTMERSENDTIRDTIRFTKQADGGWKALKLPNTDLGTLSVDGTKVTMDFEGKKHTTDLAKILGLDEGTDWKTLKEIKVGSLPIQIERKTNQLNFIIQTEKKGDTEIKRTIKVQWRVRSRWAAVPAPPRPTR